MLFNNGLNKVAKRFSLNEVTGDQNFELIRCIQQILARF